MVAGLVLGLAQLCKFTLLVFYPLLLALWVVYRLPERKTMTRQDWLRQGKMVLLLLLLSVYVINCGYLFEGTFTRLKEFRFQTTLLTGSSALEDIPPDGANRFAGTWLGELPVPLPANFVQGIDRQRYDFERGLPSYLCGQWADHGWWYYYLAALAIKLPLGTWCLVGLSLAATIAGPRPSSASWRDEIVVLVPGLVLLILVSSQTGFSVHSRYAIPLLPFLFIWTSKAGRLFEVRPSARKSPRLATAVAAALAWSITSSLWAYPHSLSYFNELVGGPKHGAEHLLNSNIDWGQDLFHLKHWLDEHPEVSLDGLAYFGSYPAILAGIPETPFPPRGPAIPPSDPDAAGDELGPRPAWYAVSVNHLYDRSAKYRYFLRFKPVDMSGYSIYIYHITLDTANRVRRELGLRELAESRTLAEERCDGGAPP
jgi:hypothetical protein